MGRIILSICAAVVAGLLCGAAQGPSDSARDQERPVYGDNGPRGHVPISADLGRIASALEAQITNDAAEREQEDLDAQKSMAKWAKYMFWAAFASAVLSGLGIVLIYVTFRETRRAANSADAIVDVTRDSAERQLRAYISVDQIMVTSISVGAPLVAWVKVQNRGQTPARNIKIRECVILCTGVPPRKAEVREMSEPHRLHDLGAGQHSNQRTPFEEEPLTEVQVSALKSGHVSFVFATYISYEDVFGKTRRYTFRANLTEDGIKHAEEGEPVYLSLAHKGIRAT